VIKIWFIFTLLGDKGRKNKKGIDILKNYLNIVQLNMCMAGRSFTSCAQHNL
jgi:hypothetical protein